MTEETIDFIVTHSLAGGYVIWYIRDGKISHCVEWCFTLWGAKRKARELKNKLKSANKILFKI